MRDVLVRPLMAEDKDNWASLWESYLAFYKTKRPAAVFHTYFARLLGDDPRDFQGLIAYREDRAIGLAHYLFHRHGWKVEETCYLQDLYVDPSARGSGLGRSLIEAVYEEADKAGVQTVYWMTQEANHTARQLYDRIGQKTEFIQYCRV